MQAFTISQDIGVYIRIAGHNHKNIILNKPRLKFNLTELNFFVNFRFT